MLFVPFLLDLDFLFHLFIELLLALEHLRFVVQNLIDLHHESVDVSLVVGVEGESSIRQVNLKSMVAARRSHVDIFCLRHLSFGGNLLEA